MSDIDLVNVYVRAYLGEPGDFPSEPRGVAAVEAAVREQIARDLDAEADRRRVAANETAAARGGARDRIGDGTRLGFTLAARIARGES